MPDTTARAAGADDDNDDDAFNNPIGGATFDRALRVPGVLRVPGLGPASRLLDLGCGRGEMLVRAAERHGAGGVGVDRDADLIAVAREQAAARAPAAALAFHAADAVAFDDAAHGPFDLAACVGASHVFGGFAATVRRLLEAVLPGGYVLVGDVYWRRDPPAEYLAVLGADRADHLDHAATAAAGVAEGLTLVYTAVASEAEWDHFEGRFWARRLRAAFDRGDEAAVAKVRQWQDAYLRWGRETMGFGLYLYRRG